jgi:hypothetical protein
MADIARIMEGLDETDRYKVAQWYRLEFVGYGTIARTGSLGDALQCGGTPSTH